MNNETLATELVKEAKVNAKRWFIAFLVVLGLWFATIGGFIIYQSLPEEISAVEQTVESSHDNNLVGGDYYVSPSEGN